MCYLRSVSFLCLRLSICTNYYDANIIVRWYIQIHCILYSVYSALLPALYIQQVITSRWPKVCVVQLSATCNLSPTATNKYDAEQDWSCTRAATQQHSPLLRSLAGAICDDMYSCTPAELSRCANQPTQVSDRLWDWFHINQYKPKTEGMWKNWWKTWYFG